MRRDPREQFGREAAKYLTSAVHADPQALGELVTLVPKGGGTIVDVGTGAGHMAFALAPHADWVIATDPTPAMLEVTAAEAAKRGLDNLETRVAFAEDLPFDDGSLDGVSCRVAAHHFENVAKFGSEVARCLKPGGWLLLVDTLSPEDDQAAVRLNEFEAIRDPSHGRNLKVSEWESHLAVAGLTVRTVRQRAKRLDFRDWMDRMSVGESDRRRLEGILAHSSGPLREYFEPTSTSFNLWEVTILAVKCGQ